MRRGELPVKRVSAFVVCLFLLPVLFTGCGGLRQTAENTNAPVITAGESATTAGVSTAAPDISVSKSAAPPTENPVKANDGVFRTLYSSEYTTLNYLVTGNTSDLKAAANLIDGLVEYDSYGSVLPALAQSWSSNDDDTVWTFQIRQGVKWVDKDGAAVADVTAQDWVDAVKYIDDAHNKCALQYTYEGYIKGASEYYSQTDDALRAENAVSDGSAGSVDAYYKDNGVDPSGFITFGDVGVKALDTYTLEYTLETPCPYFISLLSYSSYLPAYGPFLAKQGESFGAGCDSLLYNGAYILSDYEPSVQHIFKANPLYWDKGKVYIPEYDEIYNTEAVTLGPEMFKNREVGETAIGADILDQWITGSDTKNLVRSNVPVVSYSYFYMFNFEPRFDAQYEPDNWMKAVNNEDFRQALMYGMDRVKALSITEPYNPDLLVNNTITPVTFAAAGGKDFTQLYPLKPFSDGDMFNADISLSYRDKARSELTDAGVSFPVKILMPYNPSVSGWEEESGEIKQQLEDLLGADFIDIIPEAGPAVGFLDNVRRTGGYALMKCNWGADYADPQTWTEPFSLGNTYNFMYTDGKKALGGQAVTNKSEDTQAVVTEYYTLTNAAKSQISDTTARYEAFAEAESYLLQHAMVIPFSIESAGYTASLTDPFSYMFSPYGLPPYRYKGVKLMKQPMSESEFKTAYAQWKDKRAQAAP